MSTRKRTVRSTQELEARYLRFCINNDLDSDLPPEEQITSNERHQKWLDRHIKESELASCIASGSLEPETAERFETPSEEDTNNAVNRILDDLAMKENASQSTPLNA